MTYYERLIKTTDYYIVVEETNGNVSFPISDGAFGEGIYVYQTPQRAKDNIVHQEVTTGSVFYLYHLQCQVLNARVQATTCAVCINESLQVGDVIQLDKAQWVSQTGEILNWKGNKNVPQPENDVIKAQVVIGPVEDMRLKRYMLGTMTKTFRSIRFVSLLQVFTQLHFFRKTTLRKNTAICMCLRDEAILNKMFTIKEKKEGPSSYFDIIK